MNAAVLALGVGVGIFVMFLGFARNAARSASTADIVAQRLQVYGGEKPLTMDEIELQKGLPDAMDLLVIAVDAGLGFDAALARVVEKQHGALSDEFAKVLREVSLGRPRLEAMDEMGRSSGVEDLHNFIQAIIQSEQF